MLKEMLLIMLKLNKLLSLNLESVHLYRYVNMKFYKGHIKIIRLHVSDVILFHVLIYGAYLWKFNFVVSKGKRVKIFTFLSHNQTLLSEKYGRKITQHFNKSKIK